MSEEGGQDLEALNKCHGVGETEDCEIRCIKTVLREIKELVGQETNFNCHDFLMLPTPPHGYH